MLRVWIDDMLAALSPWRELIPGSRWLTYLRSIRGCRVIASFSGNLCPGAQLCKEGVSSER